MSRANRTLVAQSVSLLGLGIVLTVGMLIVLGDPQPMTTGNPPVLDCPATIKANGGDLCGTATDTGDITVTAEYRPSRAAFGKDTTTTNGVNDFCFSLDDAQPGDVIKVTAIDSQGNRSDTLVEVMPCS